MQRMKAAERRIERGKGVKGEICVNDRAGRKKGMVNL